jgi:N-acyl-phosphatidylethanolamine-hydrolysing phospholipase D
MSSRNAAGSLRTTGTFAFSLANTKHIPSTHTLSLQQHRSYLYLPTSWTELQLRLRATLFEHKREIQVRLKESWNDKKAAWAERRVARQIRWTTRRLQSQHWWQEQQRKRKQVWQKSKSWLQRKTYNSRVMITEYSEQDWFDDWGRPLTSRDETGRFVNPWRSISTDGVHSFRTLWNWRWDRLQRDWKALGWSIFRPDWDSLWNVLRSTFLSQLTAQANLPTTSSSRNTILPPPDQDGSVRMTWIGHATCFLQHSDFTVLTDPIFGRRASPYPNTPIGFAREVPPACSIEDLGQSIDVCMISHDHYDHLDLESVRKLKSVVQLWFVPLGIAEWLQQHAQIPEERIIEVKWWDSVRLEKDSLAQTWKVAQRYSLEDAPYHHPSLDRLASPHEAWLTCLPAQHWSSRSFFDRNYRLWSSMACHFPSEQLFYFGGDTARPDSFPLFEQIRDYLARPIDLAALPIGAYAPAELCRDAHMHPHEAVQVHEALRAQRSVGIHWGSFPLAEEPLHEPADLLHECGVAQFDTVEHGAAVIIPVRGNVSDIAISA